MEPQHQNFSGKLFYSWEQCTSDVNYLYNKFPARELINSKDSQLVGIARGGAIPAIMLSHRTGIKVTTINWSMGEYGNEAEAEDGRWCNIVSQTHSVYLVDDICDSGKTINSMLGIVRSLLGPSYADRIKVLCLWNNIASGCHVHHYANAIDRRVDQRFIVFPWENDA